MATFAFPKVERGLSMYTGHPGAILRSATDWSWGASEASRSVRCGGVGWVFFLAGTFLALVPVICFWRAVMCVASDALRGALSARAEVRNGAAGGLRLVPKGANYRGGSGRTMP